MADGSAEFKNSLRQYQAKAAMWSLVALEQGKRTLLVSPTGSGKTVMGTALVLAHGGRVLWLAHRIELLRQAADRLVSAGIEDVGILSGAERRDVDARVLVASVDSVRSKFIGEFDLVVIDEAHRSTAKSYRAVLDALPTAHVLGLTATPWRLDGTGLGDVFQEMIVATKPSRLEAAGYAIAPRTFGVSVERAREMVGGVSTRAGDYATGELSRRMVELAGDVVAERARVASGLRSIVFAVDRKHGEELLRRFLASGVSAEYVDGRTAPDDRAAIIGRLRDGHTEVVVNVDVLTEGLDVPEVQCVSIARPTRSLTRYLQYAGRAARPYDGKPAIILDHAGNAYRHDLPNVDREWSIEGREKSKGEARAFVRCCPECSAMIPAGSPSCPSCAVELRDAEKVVEEIREERLRELTPAGAMFPCVSCGESFKQAPSRYAKRQRRCERCRKLAPPMEKAVFPCVKCGESFRQKPSQYALGGRRCERCRRKRMPSKLFPCVTCGEEFRQKPSQYALGNRRCERCRNPRGCIKKKGDA